MENVIRALARGLQVVKQLQTQAPASLAELHRSTGLPKVTLLRILHTLQVEGWVYRGSGDDRYRLSYHLHDLGDNLMPTDALAEAAGPILDELQLELSWPSYVAVRRGLKMEVIERTRKKHMVAFDPEVIGVQTDILRSAIGHTYLAFCSDTEREEILERTVAGGGPLADLAADREWVEQELAQVRRLGFGRREAYRWPAPPAPNLCAIAVPVYLHGRVKACLNIVWPDGAIAPAAVASRYYPPLRAAADRLSEVLETDLALL